VIIDTLPVEIVNEFPTLEVAVPEWGNGAHVKMRAASAAEYSDIESRLRPARGKDGSLNDFKVRVIAMSAIKPDGSRLFQESDLKWLSSRSAAVVNRLFDAASQLNGMRKDDAEETEGN